jgi:4-hydroxy-tetrahydrodipicolinate reductase
MLVAVAGASGKLGRAVCVGIEAADDLTLVARVAPSLEGTGYGAFRGVEEALAGSSPSVLVDVTRPDVVAANLRAAIAAGVACVVGTTGLDATATAAIDAAARQRGVPVFYAPNFAIGAVLMMRFAAEAARHLPAVEIIEEHAATKLDRPSGTARHTADLVEATGAPRPPIHSVRLPGVVANQAVLLGGPGQVLTIRHDTTSRDAFVPGVLLAVRRVLDLPPGLTVGLDALL